MNSEDGLLDNIGTLNQAGTLDCLSFAPSEKYSVSNESAYSISLIFFI